MRDRQPSRTAMNTDRGCCCSNATVCNVHAPSSVGAWIAAEVIHAVLTTRPTPLRVQHIEHRGSHQNRGSLRLSFTDFRNDRGTVLGKIRAQQAQCEFVEFRARAARPTRAAGMAGPKARLVGAVWR